jgi:hypothetical protein
MLVKNCFRKLTASFTAIAVICVSSSIALAQAKDIAGEVTVVGQVTVNGQTAVSNSTIVSGNSVVTGPFLRQLSALERRQDRGDGGLKYSPEFF